MKTRKKRIAGLLSLLLVLMFVLSACGKSQQAGNTDKAQTTGSVTETETNDTEMDETPENTLEPTVSSGAGRLKMTLNGTDVVYAELTDTPATAEFLEQLPLTLDMTDYANREKHAHLDFTIDDSDLENIQYPYEIGDIIYYPRGPTFAMYYDHDGREISAGMEVIARLDEEGIAILGSYGNAVKVTVALSN